MAVTPLPLAKPCFLDVNGNPLVGGKIYTYIPTTTTPKNTWSDAAGTILNANPIILDIRGEPNTSGIYGDGSYRYILKDSLDNTIWDSETSSYQQSLTYAGIIAALGYVPVNPAVNITFSGNNIFNGTSDFNGAVTLDGAVTVTTSPNFNAPINITSSTLTLATLTNTDNNATASVLDLYRNSASPAASDILFSVVYSGNSATAVKRTYASISGVIVDSTNTSEDATINFKTIIAGTVADRVLIGNGLYGAGVTGTDTGAGTANFNNYYRNGTLLPRQTRIVSGALSFTASAANTTLTHGLGVVPTAFGAYIVCTTNDNGYVVGDVINLGTFGVDTVNYSTVVWANATSVGCATGSAMAIAPKGGGAVVALTYGRWNLFLWAEA